MKLKQLIASSAALLAVFSATTLYAGPDWTGAASDSSWWNVENWNWGDNAEAPSVVSESLLQPYFGWRINSAATADLGGRTATTTDGLLVTLPEDFPLTLKNGKVNISQGWVRISSKTGAKLILEDVDFSADDMLVGEYWSKESDETGMGTVVLKSGNLNVTNLRLVNNPNEVSTVIMDGGEARFHWICCSGHGGGTGRIELNGGVMKVPDFSYINWQDEWTGPNPLAAENGTTNINMTLVMNGGTLQAFPNNGGEVYEWSFVPEWMKVVVGEDGAIVDTNGHDVRFRATNIVCAANDGGFTKIGSGRLTVDKGVVWSGPTKVLGGTLDLNGGTITGPLVLGGDGKIVNATISTTDITIQNGYELAPQTYSAFENGTYTLPTLTAGAGVSSVLPVRGLLASAAAWYDPSDSDTVTTNESGHVTKVANKGSAGAAMDAVIWEDIEWSKESEATLPTASSINGLTAIQYSSNNTGLVSANKYKGGFVSAGKSVFAVAHRSGENDQDMNAVEWLSGGWVCDGRSAAGVRVGKWATYAYYANGNKSDTESEAEISVEWDLGAGNEQLSRSASVHSLRQSPLQSGASRLSLGVSGYDSGRSEPVDSARTIDAESVDTRTIDEMRVAYGWGMAGGWRSYGVVGEALAFDRCLSDDEAAIVHAYLGHKWVSAEIPDASVKVSVGTLTLEGGTVGFEGSGLTVGTLVGSGKITDVANVKVMVKTVAKIRETGAAISVDAALDLSDTTLELDESEFQIAVGQKVTVFSSTSITGTPTLILAEGDARRLKVRNVGTAVTLERVQPGLSVFIR